MNIVTVNNLRFYHEREHMVTWLSYGIDPITKKPKTTEFTSKLDAYKHLVLMLEENINLEVKVIKKIKKG